MEPENPSLSNSKLFVFKNRVSSCEDVKMYPLRPPSLAPRPPTPPTDNRPGGVRPLLRPGDERNRPHHAGHF